MMNQLSVVPSDASPELQAFIKKLNDEAEAEGLSSWMELMAKQDPAIADIMARMMKAEIDNRDSLSAA